VVLEAWVLLWYELVLKEIGRGVHICGGIARSWEDFRFAIMLLAFSMVVPWRCGGFVGAR